MNWLGHCITYYKCDLEFDSLCGRVVYVMDRVCIFSIFSEFFHFPNFVQPVLDVPILPFPCHSVFHKPIHFTFSYY